MSDEFCRRGVAVDLPALRPSEVWAILTDGARLASLAGKEVTLSAQLGAPVRIFGAEGKVVEARADEELAFEFVPAAGTYERGGDTGTATVRLTLSAEGEGTELDLTCVERSHRACQAATDLWWGRFLRGLYEGLTLPPEPDALPPEGPPQGSDRAALLALLGDASRDVSAWAAALAERGKKRPRGAWWKLKSPATLGLFAWGAAVGALGRPVRVRAALSAARLAEPVWARAETERPPMFDLVAQAMGPGKEAGEPPLAQLAALEAWLACPTRVRARAAIETTDRTRQLRYVDRDLGDLGRSRFVYALEAASAAVGAIADAQNAEAPIALTCAAEALVEAPAPAKGATPCAGEDEAARVAIAVAAALRAWLATSPEEPRDAAPKKAKAAKKASAAARKAR